MFFWQNLRMVAQELGRLTKSAGARGEIVKTFAATVVKSLSELLDYSPPVNPDPFVLDETRPYDSVVEKAEKSADDKSLEQLELLIRFSKRLEQCSEKVKSCLANNNCSEEWESLKLELAALEEQWKELLPLQLAYRSNQEVSKLPISTSLEENKQALETIYRLPLNKDVAIRDFTLAGGPYPDAAVVYMEGLIDGKRLEEFILTPLMNPLNFGKIGAYDAIDQFVDNVLPSATIKKIATYEELEEGVNSGDTALLIDGLSAAILIGTKGWEHRSVGIPQTEQTVRGSQAAFSENLRVNTGLIRSMLRTSDLTTEMVTVGKRGQLSCAIMYLSSIANDSLVKEVKRRLQGISTDYVIDSGQLMQFIEDDPQIIFPQTLSTERPDRVANYLVEGHVALVLEGNPFAQIVPVSFFSFFHSAEDFSTKVPLANFMRILRLFGAMLSSILPAFYIAIAYFHQEAIPTEMLMAVAGSHENVPFPAIVEVVLMELSFELIREAGVRIPGVLGSTIGIVGAIILGQAAVTAKIVSPIIVVIVAITGLASFTIPEYRMASTVRLLRFILLLFAWISGLVGLAVALVGITVLLSRLKSFGVPYMAPIGPRTIANYDVVLRGPAYEQEKRPDELNTKDLWRQPKISRKWRQQPSEGDE